MLQWAPGTWTHGSGMWHGLGHINYQTRGEPTFLRHLVSKVWTAFQTGSVRPSHLHCRHLPSRGSVLVTLHSEHVRAGAHGLHAFACLFAALRSTADLGSFCTQVGLRGGVYRVHKHAQHGGVSRSGRGRQPIRQAATSTAISASVFQHARARTTSTSDITEWFGDFFVIGITYLIPSLGMSC